MSVSVVMVVTFVSIVVMAFMSISFGFMLVSFFGMVMTFVGVMVVAFMIVTFM